MIWRWLSAVVIAAPALSFADPAQPTRCEGALCCSEWAIDVRKPGGAVWGTILGDTPGEVREKLAAAQGRDEAFCRFFDQQPCVKDHANPAPLRCSGSGAATTNSADACGRDLERRLDALTKRFEAQTTRLRLMDKLITTVQSSATAIGPVSAFGGPLQALGSYGIALNDAVARTQRLRDAMGLECLRPAEDAAGSAGEQLFYGVTFPKRTGDPMAALYGPRWAGGGFGGETERARDAGAVRGRIDDLEKVARAELPPFPSVTVPLKGTETSALAKSDRPSGQGRIVIADFGVVEVEAEVPLEDLAAVFVYPNAKSELRLGSITMSSKKTARGEVITLVGRAGSHTETVTIVIERDPEQRRQQQQPNVAVAPPPQTPTQPAQPAGPTPVVLGRCDAFAQQNSLIADLEAGCASGNPGSICNAYDSRPAPQTPVPNAVHCFMTPWRNLDGSYRNDLKHVWACCVRQ